MFFLLGIMFSECFRHVLVFLNEIGCRLRSVEYRLGTMCLDKMIPSSGVRRCSALRGVG